MCAKCLRERVVRCEGVEIFGLPQMAVHGLFEGKYEPRKFFILSDKIRTDGNVLPERDVPLVKIGCV
ncbi:hypothetical protein D3C87_2013340 [compost metagenome]